MWPSYLENTHANWLGYMRDPVKSSVSYTLSHLQMQQDLIFELPHTNVDESFNIENFNLRSFKLFSELESFNFQVGFGLELSKDETLLEQQAVKTSIQDLFDEMASRKIEISLKHRKFNSVNSSSFVIEQSINYSNYLKFVSTIAQDELFRTIDRNLKKYLTQVHYRKTCLIVSTELTRIYLASNFNFTQLEQEFEAKQKLQPMRSFVEASHTFVSFLGKVTSYHTADSESMKWAEIVMSFQTYGGVDKLIQDLVNGVNPMDRMGRGEGKSLAGNVQAGMEMLSWAGPIGWTVGAIWGAASYWL